jgi:ribosomal protein S18 acetylase RimI-like enzyme
MSLALSPFKAADAFELILQPAQRAEIGWHDRQRLARAFEDAGNAFTVRQKGRVIFCGGAAERHEGYASLWGMFALEKRAATFRLLAMTRRFIADLPHGRVDAMVEDVPAARRWAELLGLTHETTLESAAASGRDMLVYRRMN